MYSWLSEWDVSIGSDYAYPEWQSVVVICAVMCLLALIGVVSS